MNALTQVTDSLSLFFIAGAALLLALTQGFGRRGLSTISDLIIPVGIIGALTGLIGMLGNMSDIKAIPSALFIVMTVFLYSLVIRWLIGEQQQTAELDSDLKFKLAGYAGLMLLITWNMINVGELNYFIHAEAILFLACTIGLLAGRNLIAKQPAFTGLQQKLVSLGLFGFLLGLALMLNAIDNPKSLGPPMAFGYLSLYYALLVLLTLRIFAPDNSDVSSTTWQSLGLPFLLGATASISILLLSLSYT